MFSMLIGLQQSEYGIVYID
uniref:Uncharacterized protein n=1 Tax=Arundo donax TaxID=35708 RepID=A0A0A9C4W3_ARUDO